MFHRWSGSATKPEIWVTPNFVDGTVSAGYSFRKGGYSDAPYDGLNLGYHVGDDPDTVLKNREAVAEHGFGPVNEWVVAKQVHGNNVAVVGKSMRGAGALPDAPPIEDSDALVTNEPDTTLVVLVADCVPVLFYDPVHKAIGAAHSGWRGTTAHIVQQVILHMNFLYQTEAADLRVSIGPSIRRCCYEVDEKVATPVAEQFGETYLTPRFGMPGKYLLSLQDCISHDLRQMGVRPLNIDDTGICTSCHTDVLYSHRKEHGQTGRECGLIRLSIEDLGTSR